jgi:cytoskeletal protein CcmA (bactofilin family)
MQFSKGKASSEALSQLSEGAEFVGEISFKNGLRVNGFIKGKVRSEATLEIGQTGKLDAEVHVKKIIIRGEFHGIINASDRVEILKEGRVYGDIYTPCLIIEAGALFEGHCNMSQTQGKANQPPEMLKASQETQKS